MLLSLLTVAVARFLSGKISESNGLPIYLVSAVATRLLFERSWCLIVRSVVWRLTNASASKCLMGTYLTVLSNNKFASPFTIFSGLLQFLYRLFSVYEDRLNL